MRVGANGPQQLAEDESDEGTAVAVSADVDHRATRCIGSIVNERDDALSSRRPVPYTESARTMP